MIAGLPVPAWALLAASVVLGFAIELAFFLRQRARRNGKRTEPDEGAA